LTVDFAVESPACGQLDVVRNSAIEIGNRKRGLVDCLMWFRNSAIEIHNRKRCLVDCSMWFRNSAIEIHNRKRCLVDCSMWFRNSAIEIHNRKRCLVDCLMWFRNSGWLTREGLPGCIVGMPELVCLKSGYWLGSIKKAC